MAQAATSRRGWYVQRELGRARWRRRARTRASGDGAGPRPCPARRARSRCGRRSWRRRARYRPGEPAPPCPRPAPGTRRRPIEAQGRISLPATAAPPAATARAARDGRGPSPGWRRRCRIAAPRTRRRPAARRSLPRGTGRAGAPPRRRSRRRPPGGRRDRSMSLKRSRSTRKKRRAGMVVRRMGDALGELAC